MGTPSQRTLWRTQVKESCLVNKENHILLSPCCARSLSHVRLFGTPQTQPTRLLGPWGFSRQEHWSGLECPPLGDLPNPGIELRSPTMQMDSLPSEPRGKPKNTGGGSLSLLQWNFPTLESNQDLQHCRWILYQLSYQGSPFLG